MLTKECTCTYSFFTTVGLVVITEMAGYAIAPGAMHLSTFLWAGLGTGLCSSSANAINQVCTFHIIIALYFKCQNDLGILCGFLKLCFHDE